MIGFSVGQMISNMGGFWIVEYIAKQKGQAKMITMSVQELVVLLLVVFIAGMLLGAMLVCMRRK